MSETKTIRAFGLSIAVPASLAAASGASVAADERAVDVTIRLSDPLPGEARFDADVQEWEASPGRLVLAIDRVARYTVTDGRLIEVRAARGVSPDRVAAFLFGSVLGAVLHQRGCLPLHGSAVEVDDGCALFVGPSGAGKSTLVAALAGRGRNVVTDDIAVVSASDGDGGVRLLPGLPRIKLWGETATRLGLDAAALDRVRPDLDKFQVFSFPHREHESALPLQAVYVLGAAAVQAPTIALTRGQDKLGILLQNTFRQCFVRPLGRQQAHFDACIEVAQRVPFFSVARPSDRFALAELVDALEAHWQRDPAGGARA